MKLQSDHILQQDTTTRSIHINTIKDLSTSFPPFMTNGGGSSIGSDEQYTIPYSPPSRGEEDEKEQLIHSPVFRSLPDYGALSPDRLSSTTIPSIAPFSFQKNIYRDLLPDESVQFSAFAPSSVTCDSKFLLTIYAYLKRQKQELYDMIHENDIESGRRSVISIRHGAYVSIQVICPDGFTISDGQNCKRFQWFEKLTRIPFEIQCHSPSSEQSIFKVTIVIGCQVVKMNVTILMGVQMSMEIEQLHTDIRTLCMNSIEPVYDTISYNDLKMKQLVGKGHFGEAYLAEYKNQDIIVKTYRPEVTTTEEFCHEATISALFGHHPRIVPFIGASTEPFALMTEYLPLGSIQQQFAKGKSFTMSEKTQMLHDTATGLLNLHESSFVHRDVAARNCLLDTNNRVKICDFGLTRKIQHELTFGTASDGGMGPLKWMAPESITPPHVFFNEIRCIYVWCVNV